MTDKCSSCNYDDVDSSSPQTVHHRSELFFIIGRAQSECQHKYNLREIKSIEKLISFNPKKYKKSQRIYDEE